MGAAPPPSSAIRRVPRNVCPWPGKSQRSQRCLQRITASQTAVDASLFSEAPAVPSGHTHFFPARLCRLIRCHSASPHLIRAVWAYHPGGRTACTPAYRAAQSLAPRADDRAAEQRDAADEGRLDAYGSIIVGKVIVNGARSVRPSQLITSVRWACGEECGERRFGHGARSPSRPLGVPSPGPRRDRPGVVAQQQVGSSPRLASPSGTAAHLAS